MHKGRIGEEEGDWGGRAATLSRDDTDIKR